MRDYCRQQIEKILIQTRNTLAHALHEKTFHEERAKELEKECSLAEARIADLEADLAQ